MNGLESASVRPIVILLILQKAHALIYETTLSLHNILEFFKMFSALTEEEQFYSNSCRKKISKPLSNINECSDKHEN